MSGNHLLTAIDVHRLAESIKETYYNAVLSTVNDHVIRISIMHTPYYWHYHPNSDETFLVLEGTLLIELDEAAVQLTAGQLYTVPAGKAHRTSPLTPRSVNLTVEHSQLQTVMLQR
jgi:mannose-6-phosphate isomerase-like protein (cupin superfamily)